MNFDFMGAKLKHSSWKLHIREFLDGKPGLTAAQATSHRECDLGKWLYSEGLGKYGSIAEMKQLESVHEELHRQVRQIMELKAAGRASEAEAAYNQIDPISKRLVTLLSAVEAAVTARAR
ncbi:MAG: CZB domain-containing protein [Phycisphaerales bacterium]|nr:CZB domain-containing protein [Phycisphaerales bacterium]